MQTALRKAELIACEQRTARQKESFAGAKKYEEDLLQFKAAFDEATEALSFENREMRAERTGLLESNADLSSRVAQMEVCALLSRL